MTFVLVWPPCRVLGALVLCRQVGITAVNILPGCSTAAIVISSSGSGTVALKGWQITRAVTTTYSDKPYIFPARAHIPAGGSVTVWAGNVAKYKAQEGGPTHLFWTAAHVWGLAGQVTKLVASDGKVVSQAGGGAAEPATRALEARTRHQKRPRSVSPPVSVRV